MGRDATRRPKPGLAAKGSVAALSVMSALVVLAPIGSQPAAAAKKGTTLPKATQLAQSGHAAFWSCPAKSTLLLAVVNTLTLHPGSTLQVSFTVRNGGTAPCNYTAPYAAATPGPTSTALTAGPCGSVGFQIEDTHHHNVWPGAQVVNCPALGFAQLAAGATVSGTGSWNQDKPNSTHRVAPGSYILVVGSKRFTFPIRVAKS